MLSSAQSQRTVGRLAWVAAWIGLVVGQLHALARHNTADGAGDLKLPLTRVWSDPARSALRPLLDWADADTVYLTYGKIWLPVFVAFTLCAIVVRRRASFPPASRKPIPTSTRPSRASSAASGMRSN